MRGRRHFAWSGRELQLRLPIGMKTTVSAVAMIVAGGLLSRRSNHTFSGAPSWQCLQWRHRWRTTDDSTTSTRRHERDWSDRPGDEVRSWFDDADRDRDGKARRTIARTARIAPMIATVTIERA